MDSDVKVTVGFIGIVIVLIIIIDTIFSGFSYTDSGFNGVVRNGGWFDNSDIRIVNNQPEIVPQNSSYTWIGLHSTMHQYPAQQRTYTITSDSNSGDKSGVDVVYTPSKDGVNMGIEGTFFFTLNGDPNILADFDRKFGTRTFNAADGTTHNAWGDDAGWSAFLDQIVRPVINQTLRQQIGDFRCSDLISSCALVQNQGSAPAAAPAAANNQILTAIQNAVNVQFATDLNNTLGGPFLTGTQFNLSKVTLPTQVQSAVDQAQVAFAQVSQSQAHIQSSQLDAQANEIQQQGYNACSVCGQIAILKALPQGLTTYAPGTGATVPLGH